MNAAVIARFLLGNASAIREVASNRGALWTGIVLVLITAIPRNYDQSFILESPFWLFGPLIFSFFSGSYLYWVLIRGFARRRFEQKPDKQWAGFMAVFWMMAPVAWFYAIPVERFLNSYQAAQANLVLLGIVSAWRVLLMSRAMAVLHEIPFMRAFGWVLVGAALEVIIVLFFGAFTSGRMGRQIMAGMAGMRNSPEEALLNSALSVVWTCSWIILVIAVIAIYTMDFNGAAEPLPRPAPGKVPWRLLALTAALWICIAIPSQIQQRRFLTHAALVEKGDYADALAYLAKRAKSDFPPARRLEPNPYEVRVWDELPPTISLLTSNTPSWIRETYFSHLRVTLSHYHSGYTSLTNVAGMYAAIEKLPEGRQWVLSNQVALGKSIGIRNYGGSLEPRELAAKTNILAAFRRMGMAETNVSAVFK